MATGRISRTDRDGELSQDHDPCLEPGRTVEREAGRLEIQTRCGSVNNANITPTLSLVQF